MKTTQPDLITVHGLKTVTIASTAEARQQRDELLTLTATVRTVANAEEAQRATFVLKDVKALTRLIEDTRKTVKAPVLEQCQQIDAIAKELTARLEGEATRISNVLGVWTAEQNRIAEDKRRTAWDEEQRILRDAREKEEAAKRRDDEERAELVRKGAAAHTPAAMMRAEQKLANFDAKAEQAKTQRDLGVEQAIVSTRVTAAASMPARPAGIATRREPKFEVTDVVALYEAAPYLVTLTPNIAAIKSAVKGLTGQQTLPGVRHWFENQALVRG